jgi:hypothetical protein
MRSWFWLAALTAAPLLAETNFAGSWVLNLSKSQYGNFPAPEVMLRTIEQSGVTLKMSTYQKGAQGEVTTDLAYTTDGQPSVNGASRGVARWEGEALVIESSRELQGARLTQREVWTLSPDGKTLTIVNQVTLPDQGQFQVTQVFEKAPAAGRAARVAF